MIFHILLLKGHFWCLSFRCDLKIRNERALHLSIFALVLGSTITITCANFLVWTDRTRINWHNIIVKRRLEENLACSSVCFLFLSLKNPQTNPKQNRTPAFQVQIFTVKPGIDYLEIKDGRILLLEESFFRVPVYLAHFWLVSTIGKTVPCLHFP